MEIATLVIISTSCLVSFTGYTLYTTFGKPFKQLRDLSEDHED